MVLETRAATKQRSPNRQNEEARFERWQRDFDARMAYLTARQERLLWKLGVEPVSRPTERESASWQSRVSARSGG